MAGLKVEQPVVGKGWAAILTCAPIYSHCNSWAPIGQSVSQTKTRCILVQCNEQGDIVITIGTAIFMMKIAVRHPGTGKDASASAGGAPTERNFKESHLD